MTDINMVLIPFRGVCRRIQNPLAGIVGETLNFDEIVKSRFQHVFGTSCLVFGIK
jgi:hypothetical protein